MLLNRQKKPAGPTAKYRAKRRRAETAIAVLVRAKCVERDGYCRVSQESDDMFRRAMCDGPSEWAHFDEKKRAKTRGMTGEERHTTEGSLMLCRQHHEQYDHGILQIIDLTPRGCDGSMHFRDGSMGVTERNR